MTIPPPAIRPGEPDDETLIEACIAGDDAAWTTLVDRYGRLVFSIPRRYRFDRTQSEDAFQEVFAILFRQLPRLRNRAGLPKWLMTTTHRVCRQIIRRRTLPLDPLHPALEQAAPPQDLLAEWERAHAVRGALRALGGRCEELLTALYLERAEVRYEHIAERLGMPIGSIGPTRARCLEKLLELLEKTDRSG
ncbi:MAG: sigma-70 family RNA polymerase sigma factor [Phycisphaerales bacterium]|nr:sigma-70 family RNA polymerase sigma factor [Phycisphaerae bacterium]NNF43449.1 sigma-70 family RNA polymerase sigma factor [Phycisphaerales bacterium]NNM26468.1 sigma-70 family RNA polymerase sigma factor [Phycisphaerales bacterium]